jgi:hypothetical protein
MLTATSRRNIGLIYAEELLLFGVWWPESTSGTCLSPPLGRDCILTTFDPQKARCIVDYEQAHDQVRVNAKYDAGLRARARPWWLASRSTWFSMSPNRCRLTASPPHPSPTISSFISVCRHLSNLVYVQYHISLFPSLNQVSARVHFSPFSFAFNFAVLTLPERSRVKLRCTVHRAVVYG